MAWRKSWVYKNIHGHGNGDKGKKRALLPDERSVWDDYLDMATPPNTPVAGQVCISNDLGYTLHQLSGLLRTDPAIIERANARMIQLNMVTVENTGIVIINNWKSYQSEYERQKGYRDRLQPKVTGKGNVVDIDIDIDSVDIHKRKKDKEKKYIKKENKLIYSHILSVWNEKKIIQHRSLTDRCYGTINRKLENGYTEAELLQAINNYNTILKGGAYFWTHRWTLQEFLQRGLDKFMDLEVAKENYINKYGNKREELLDDISDLKGRHK